MKYPWIDEYLMAKRSVTKDLQEEWNWIRYHIGGKMFAAILLDDDNQPYYINLKLEPLEGELMRQQYPDISPDTTATSSTGIPSSPTGRFRMIC